MWSQRKKMREARVGVGGWAEGGGIEEEDEEEEETE